jgi:uncharacterized membrane protein HdeD (DUF308 family)
VEGRDNNAGGAVEWVTIREAATLLGVHYNTVSNRRKAGMYRAEKVMTENGLTWMIDRASLTNNAPTSASQQPVVGVPPVQQEAIQELARSLVKEAGIAQDPEAQATLESNKMAMEAAKTQLFVGSGLLVGMGAVVGIMPGASLASPLLYFAFAFVVLSVYCGMVWMREIADETGRSVRHPIITKTIPNIGGLSSLLFALGLGVFAMYVLFNSPPDDAGSWLLSPDTPKEQSRWLAALLALLVLAFVWSRLFRGWRKRRRSEESEPPSQSS